MFLSSPLRCARFLVLKSELERKRSDLELCRSDLEQVLFLLESGTGEPIFYHIMLKGSYFSCRGGHQDADLWMSCGLLSDTANWTRWAFGIQ